MNKLDEMMDYYKLNDEDVEQMQLDQEERQRIFQATLVKAGLQDTIVEKSSFYTNYTKKNHRRRVGILLAACISVLAMGAVSFAAIHLNGGLLNFFNPQTQQDTDTLNYIGTIIDKQVSANGLTIDVKEAVGDSNAVYVTFDIIAPEGMILDKDQYAFVLNNIQIGSEFGGFGMGYYFTELEDLNVSDNIKPMMLCLSASKNLQGQNMTIRFKDFSSYKTDEEMKNIPEMTEPGTPGDENDCYNIIIPGEWEVAFPLNYRDNSRSWKLNEKVMYGDTEIKVKKVRISSISISMTLNDLEAKQTEIMEVPWLIHMKNGEAINLGNGCHGAYSGTLKGTIIDAQFDKIIQLEDIESIEFCGTVLPIAF